MKCFEALGLSPEASEQEVKRRWHRLAARHHPDQGGNATEFSRLHEAYRRCIDEVKARVCHPCKGSGTVFEQRGWNAVKVTCPKCEGTGKATTTKGG